VLRETYGVIVYQEQVMKIANVMAGFSLGAADELRRAMGKKKADVMAKMKNRFTTGAHEKGISEAVAARCSTSWPISPGTASTSHTPRDIHPRLPDRVVR
jgi:DNA polymerase III alpha subunit